jgi:hypothetical protein
LLAMHGPCPPPFGVSLNGWSTNPRGYFTNCCPSSVNVYVEEGAPWWGASPPLEDPLEGDPWLWGGYAPPSPLGALGRGWPTNPWPPTRGTQRLRRLRGAINEALQVFRVPSDELWCGALGVRAPMQSNASFPFPSPTSPIPKAPNGDGGA